MKTLRVKVKPNARAAKLTQLEDGSWVAHVKAPPVDGKANAALIELVARHFDVRKAQVSIRHGASGKHKLLEIDD